MVCVLGLGLVVGLAAPALAVANETLTDGDSTVEIDPYSSAGVFSWKIGNTNYLNQQWFWLWTEGGQLDGREHSLDELVQLPGGGVNVNQVLPNMMTLTYTGGGLEVEVTYILTDEPGPTGGSDLTEVILITNTTDQEVEVDLFQYSDFELGGDANDTKVEILDGNKANQHDTQVAVLLSETVVTGSPGSSEVDDDGSTLANLMDGDEDDLDGSTFLEEVADLTWAFQWQMTIPAHQGFPISKNKHISLTPGGGEKIPEPGSFALLALGLGGIVRLKRRK